MHVLIIGGTRFVGRHIGEELLEQGHTITLLNRGVTPDSFPAGVERLRAGPDRARTGAHRPRWPRLRRNRGLHPPTGPRRSSR